MKGEPTPAEVQALREMEVQLRTFVTYFDKLNEAYESSKPPTVKQSMFAPATIQMVESVRPVLARLDEERKQAAA